MNILIKHRSLLSLCAALALCFTLAACAPVDDDMVAANPPPQDVQQAPPQPEIELVPTIDNPQAEIWRAGYWALINGQFVWVPGKIISRPSPTAVWRAAHWVQHTYGWSFEMGHWE